MVWDPNCSLSIVNIICSAMSADLPVTKGCIIDNDAYYNPWSSGGDVYIHPPSDSAESNRHLIGQVTSWWDNEKVKGSYDNSTRH